MFRILLFVVATLAAVAVASFTPDCMRNSHRSMKCCKSIPKMKTGEKDISECEPLKRPPPSCESDMCIAKLHDFADSVEGKFDKDKLTGHLQTEFENEPEFAATVIQKCVNEDLSKFGPSDFCDLIKFRHCFHAQLSKACKDWDSTAECQKVKELAEECAS